ncbi:uncharacterized protein LTR77_001639 [Saxophila tyrrhenica]|uniref:CBM21 domain-containing protein n=1 Tax=Saxophila tyrrhenica TaxID=1690608 RepID=A0AAV9PKP2_9PEZI|nr:hypothetical protein LTR77_001639 [Saxophila tyrrhenica]
MPYTPPSAQSPASSKPTSPAISRSSSYCEDAPRSPSVGRPTPPRSMSSSSYLHKHRRSPSIAKSEGALPTPTEKGSSVQMVDFAPNGSVRQSPPPVNNLRMPTGAVLSPPDSSENSDGDETNEHQRGRERELDRNMVDELQQAVRLIDQRKEPSPDRGTTLTSETISEPVSQSTSPTALTAEARKISHSRSSTETAIIIPRTKFDSPAQSSDDSDDDEGPLSRPSLVRKKSGELVKPALRPSSRRRYSSMPGTPTYHKSVHFNESNNQTRHFLQVDKPIAVSAGTSPVEMYESESEFPFDDSKAEREIRLANFPADTFDRRTKPVRVERIFLSTDKQTLVGVIAVQNISFHKLVVARFTLDYWKTTSEVVAEYNNDPKNPTTDGCDRFNFHIKLSDQANIDNKTLLLCVRYNVGGQDYWDNNDNTNYQIDFTKVVKSSQRPVSAPGLGARPLNAIPRSRHTPPASARGQRDSIDDDFSNRFDSGSTYSFGSANQLLGESPNAVKLKPRAKFQAPTAAPTANGLGGRYDFGASLTAALSSAQEKYGRQSGLLGAAQNEAGGSYFGPIDRTEGPVKADEHPDAITTDRPAMGSDQYKDLVQKFCYFTSGPGKPAVSSPLPTATETTPSSAASQSAAKTDGADDTDAASPGSSSTSSESDSPPVDGSNEPAGHGPTTAFSPFTSRSGSPAPVTGGGMGGRAASPISFGYPYYHDARDGYLSDSHIPTAIHG